MGDDLRNFDGKYEVVRSPGGPVVHSTSRRASVEGRIHFDRGKLRGVVGKEIDGAHSLRIEASFPSRRCERRSPEENAGQRERALDLWLAREFGCLVQFLHLE